MPEGSAVYYASRQAGNLLTLEHCASMADACVRKTGEPYLYPYIEQYVDEIVTVTEESIRKAVKIEGAGAMPLAALLENKCQAIGKTVRICSGGNIDQKVLNACLNI